MDLPYFRYHPDPVATGSIVASPDTVCVCCGEIRGYVYPDAHREWSFHEEYDVGPVCPWCIASGEAHRRLGAVFVEEYHLAGLPARVREEISQRTSGYDAFQGNPWQQHHGDACAFLGHAGREELDAYESDALIASLRESARDWLPRDESAASEEFQAFYESLDRDNEPVAYVFQCLHCGTLLAYADNG